MDASGHTLSATRFAALTGVSRERLRTWERRHGFPAPRRVGRGPRRYAVEDVPRVVAVRHAAAEGVPIPEAIARARAVGDGPAALGDMPLAALVEDLPTPVVVVSGPAPMRIAYVNGAVRALPGAPAAGAVLPEAVAGFAGSVAVGALERMFATEAAATEVHHPAWGGARQAHDAIEPVPPAADPVRAAARGDRRAGGRRRAHRARRARGAADGGRRPALGARPPARAGSTPSGSSAEALGPRPRAVGGDRRRARRGRAPTRRRPTRRSLRHEGGSPAARRLAARAARRGRRSWSPPTRASRGRCATTSRRGWSLRPRRRSACPRELRAAAVPVDRRRRVARRCSCSSPRAARRSTATRACCCGRLRRARLRAAARPPGRRAAPRRRADAVDLVLVGR